jgi:hypothetical protein
MSVGPVIDMETQRKGFSTILDQCLELEKGSELLVIYDESFQEFFDALLEVIIDRGHSSAFLYLPKAYQLDLIERARSSPEGNWIRLPDCLTQSFSLASAILNMLGGWQETVALRVAVLRQARSTQGRLAHIPGIDAQILRVVSESPIPEILRSAELLAWALGEARQAEVLTIDRSGAEHTLRMDLQEWQNEPMMSPGVIFPGSWGNVPPGETFCCPGVADVDGSIVINGSVPDYVFAAGEEIVLTFEKGKMMHRRGTPGGLAYFDKEERRATLRGDLNWATVAELGIGLNPAITQLTGNSLFDEKAIRTVHIAIGDNTGFGHYNKSDIHADLVTWEPSLRLDGQEVMSRGRLHLDEIKRRRDARVTVPVKLPSDVDIFLWEGRVARRDGELKRLLHQQHRIGYVSMAGPRIGALLLAVADELTLLREFPIEEFIQRKPTFDDVPTSDLLGLLYHYRALGVSIPRT